MAVFRVEKNHNYTVMSNYHLRDTTLTLKAIGLLSKMLSLTDEWDYTTRGLAAICKEGVDAIGAALKEAELSHKLRPAFAKTYIGGRFLLNGAHRNADRHRHAVQAQALLLGIRPLPRGRSQRHRESQEIQPKAALRLGDTLCGEFCGA